MKTIELQQIEVQPVSEELRLYPDFLATRLIQLGIGVIEATRPNDDREQVDFLFTSHKTGKSEIVASIGRGFFRPLLARLGPRFGSQDMLYTGHALFACEADHNGRKHMHRFSLFVCNEPTMGIWMKLYLYCIDGIWPMPKESA